MAIVNKKHDVIDDDAVIVHAQRLMDNGDVIVPLHEFKHQALSYNQVHKTKKKSIRAASNGTTFIPNLIEIRVIIW
jgi:hypothetical protein